VSVRVSSLTALLSTTDPYLEARARAARLAVLPSDVLTGHTADDQAETVLLNLMRGAGIDGIAGMRRSPQKPLLSLRRTETHELCRLCGITVAIDESNADPRFRRNRVRHELIPLLHDIAQRDVSALLAREADLIADDERFLTDLAAALDVHDARALASASDTARAASGAPVALRPLSPRFCNGRTRPGSGARDTSGL